MSQARSIEMAMCTLDTRIECNIIQDKAENISNHSRSIVMCCQITKAIGGDLQLWKCVVRYYYKYMSSSKIRSMPFYGNIM